MLLPNLVFYLLTRRLLHLKPGAEVVAKLEVRNIQLTNSINICKQNLTLEQKSLNLLR